MPIGRRCRSLCIAAAFAATGLALSACHSKAKPDQSVGHVGNPANDQRTVDLMEKMRARAQNAPGGASEASDFAFNVTQLYAQGVTQRRSISPTLVDEAVKCLAEARAAHPDLDADLLARKGDLLLAAGKPD